MIKNTMLSVKADITPMTILVVESEDDEEDDDTLIIPSVVCRKGDVGEKDGGNLEDNDGDSTCDVVMVVILIL